MVERNIGNRVSGVNLDMDQENFSEGIRELDAEELSEISGAGLKEAIGAYSHAGKLGGGFSTKLASFWRGLKCKDEKDANTRATKIVKKKKKKQEIQRVLREQKKRQYSSF